MRKYTLLLSIIASSLLFNIAQANTIDRRCGDGVSTKVTDCSSSEPPASETIDDGIAATKNSGMEGWLSDIAADGLDIPDTPSIETIMLASENLTFKDVETDDLIELLEEALTEYASNNEALQSKLDDFQDILTNAENFYELTTEVTAQCTDDGEDMDGEALKSCIEGAYNNAKINAAKKWDEATGLEVADAVLQVINNRCESTGPKSRPLIDNNTAVGDVKKKIKALNAKYADEKEKICEVANKFSKLVSLLEQLQSVREDGISIFYAYREKGHNFGNHHRTTKFSLDVRFYPDLQERFEGGDPEPKFSIDNENSWFKFSDNDKHMLGSMLPLGDDEETACLGKLWIPVSGALKMQLYMSDIQETSAELNYCVKAGYKSHHLEMDFGPFEVTLPFGYMAAMSEMKDEGKQKLMQEIGDLLGDAFGNDKAFEEVGADLGGRQDLNEG